MSPAGRLTGIAGWWKPHNLVGRRTRILFSIIELSWDSGGLLKFHTAPSHPCLVWAPCSMHCLIGVWKQWGCLFRLHSLQMHHSIASISMCFPWKWGESDKCKFSGGLHKDHRMHPTIAAISIPPLKVGESDKFDKSGGLNTEQRWLQ